MLGKKLVKLRKSAGLTQDELSELLNISRGTYAHYEINKRNPDYETLKLIADFYGVTTDYLLGHDRNNMDELIANIPPDVLKFVNEYPGLIKEIKLQKEKGYSDTVIVEWLKSMEIMLEEAKKFFTATSDTVYWDDRAEMLAGKIQYSPEKLPWDDEE